jgi:hypothetical protein
VHNDPVNRFDPTGLCGTGTRIEGQDSPDCKVAYQAPAKDEAQTKEDAPKPAPTPEPSAPPVPEQTPTSTEESQEKQVECQPVSLAEGCGSGASEWVPDLYPEACRIHDQCYSTLDADRATCDNEFFCNAFTESGSSPNVLVPGLYYLGIRLWGEKAFLRAQEKARQDDQADDE